MCTASCLHTAPGVLLQWTGERKRNSVCLEHAKYQHLRVCLQLGRMLQRTCAHAALLQLPCT